MIYNEDTEWPATPGVYILRNKATYEPIYVGVSRNLARRLGDHERRSEVLNQAGLEWSEVAADVIALPKAEGLHHLLQFIEISLIAGIGPKADGGPLLNVDAGGSGGHTLSPEALSARATKANITKRRAAAAKKAVATRQAKLDGGV